MVNDTWNTETTVTLKAANGSSMIVKEGADFVSSVKEAAKNAGYAGNFKVYLNGGEINPADAPSTITEGMNISIASYDKAG